MEQIVYVVLAGLAGAGVAGLLVPWIIAWHRTRALPETVRDLHHTHSVPVPRLGGVALAVAFALVAVFLALVGLTPVERAEELRLVVLGALAMFGLGFWDDLKPLGARRKLLGQILISAITCFLGVNIEVVSNPVGEGSLQLGAWSAVVTILWLVAFTNLINLVDGLDGLAGGLSLMLLGLLAFVQFQSGTTPFLCAALMGALLVFLCYNFPPARIYLGDGGAYFLGFFIAALTIVSSQKGTVAAALIAPLFVLTLPMIDAALALLRRGLKGLPIFRPDRGHIHHRLLEMGMSRRRAVLTLYGFTLVFLVLALVLWWGKGRGWPVIIGFGVLSVLLVAGHFDFSREWFAVGRVLGNSMGMREEVAYALSVTRWLRQEIDRVKSMDEFWRLMCFAAERLGFTALTLDLPDGRREWKGEEHPVAFHCRRFDLKSAGAGVIELRARVCHHLDSGGPKQIQVVHCGRSTACVGDRRVFGVVTELFVEAWHKASREFLQITPTLQFDTRFDRQKVRTESPLSRIRRFVTPQS